MLKLPHVVILSYPLLRLIEDISQGHPMENWSGKLGEKRAIIECDETHMRCTIQRKETMRKLGLLLRHNRLSAEDCLAPLTLRCFVLQA